MPYCILSKWAFPKDRYLFSWSTGICGSVCKDRQLVKFPFYPIPVFFSAFGNRSASKSKQWCLNHSESPLHPRYRNAHVLPVCLVLTLKQILPVSYAFFKQMCQYPEENWTISLNYVFLTAERKQPRKFLGCMEDDFMTQLVTWVSQLGKAPS